MLLHRIVVCTRTSPASVGRAVSCVVLRLGLAVESGVSLSPRPTASIDHRGLHAACGGLMPRGFGACSDGSSGRRHGPSDHCLARAEPPSGKHGVQTTTSESEPSCPVRNPSRLLLHRPRPPTRTTRRYGSRACEDAGRDNSGEGTGSIMPLPDAHASRARGRRPGPPHGCLAQASEVPGI